MLAHNTFRGDLNSYRAVFHDNTTCKAPMRRLTGYLRGYIQTLGIGVMLTSLHWVYFILSVNPERPGILDYWFIIT